MSSLGFSWPFIYIYTQTLTQTKTKQRLDYVMHFRSNSIIKEEKSIEHSFEFIE